jgi:hypothetical protein
MDTSHCRGHAWRRLAALGLGLLAFGGGAWADANPYRVGAGIAFGSDDNLFRSGAGTELADHHTTLSVFGGVDQPIGRQRLQGGATLRSSHYARRQDLDHTGFELMLGWSGATQGEISWELAHETKRRLASYGTAVRDEFRVADLETSHVSTAAVQLGLDAIWVAKLTLAHREIDHSAAVYASDRVRMDSAGFGLTWNPLGPLTASAGPRFTSGRRPQVADAAGGTTSDDFTRQDIDFGLRWVASGASTLNARLSLTRQRDALQRSGDFDGATGQLDWQWTLTGKTRLDVALRRDTGSESSFVTAAVAGESLRGTSDTSQLTNSLTARIGYELTGKTSLLLSGSLAERQLRAATLLADGSSGSTAGNDRSGRLALGLRYLPTRNAIVACDLGHERRATRSSLSSAYRANTVGCSAQLTLQ